MKEKIRWGKEKRVYQPRIRSVRIHDLHNMKEFTHRPMTTLVDEALAMYLSSFLTSPEYTAFCEQIERGIDEQPEPNTDEWEDLDSFLY